MRYLYVLLVTAAGLSAQPATTATKPEDLASVEGQVVNSVTGEPVAKASLTLYGTEGSPSGPPPSYSTTSDAAGRFRIPGVEPGRYRLRSARNGFTDLEYGSRGPTKPGTILTLAPAAALKDLAVKLTPHGVVTGRILDEDGDPVAGVQVQLMRLSYNQGKRQLSYVVGSPTNDLGEYRLYGISAGKYTMCAMYQTRVAYNAFDRSPQPDEDYVPSYYPGTLDPANAVQLEITAGATLSGINMKLSKARTVRIKGRVTQSVAPGRAVISVFAAPRRIEVPNLNRSRAANPNGDFEIAGLLPGPHLVRAMMNLNGRAYTAVLPLEVGSRNIEGVNLTIIPGVPVSVKLRVDGQTTESLSGVQISLGPRESGMVMMGNYAAKLNPDGGFRIDDVPPGSYSVNVFALPSGFYVKSIRSGEADVLNNGIEITGAAAPVEIVLSPNAGQFTGTVNDPAKGQPAVDATVVLIPQEPARRAMFGFYKMSFSDHTGRFSFRDLTPGEYKVFAWEDIETGAYMDPEVMKHVESKGEAVTIREGTSGPVQVQLIPADSPSRQ